MELFKILLATLFGGIAAILFKKSTHSIGAANTTLFYYLFGFCWSVLIWWQATDKVLPSKIGLIWPALTSLFLALSVILYNRALENTPLSIAAPIYGMSFLIPAMAGMVFFSEPFLLKNFIALGLAIASVLVFRLG